MNLSFEILWRWLFALCLSSAVLGITLMVLPGTGAIGFYDAGMLKPFWGTGAPAARAIDLLSL